jgi:diadenosine tetraphosphate (Ap4A) HIT family hydrolase
MAMTACPICQAVALCRAGEHPGLLAELDESYAVLGDNQGCPGWSVLLLKTHVEHLADLPIERQTRLWRDVSRTAAAIRRVFPTGGPGGAPVRINYECLGNLVPHIHWHLIPRHASDPGPGQPVWGWPPDRLRGGMTDPQRRELRDRIRVRLEGR